MSNLGLDMSPESAAPQGPRHRGLSWVAVLLSFLVLVGIGLAVRMAVELIPEFGGPPDYTGEGSDPVVSVVEQGNTLAEIGQTLKADGVVASVDAWLAAAKKEPLTAKIAPGSYDMLTEMSAESAVARMVDPQTRITDDLLLREGLRIDQTFDTISKETGLKVSKLEKVSEGGKIGLPAYADDNAEGFLFPARYDLDKGESAKSVLSRLVARWDKAAAAVDLEAGAKKVGYTPYEVMIVASLIQSEGRPDDFDKVARVIYNRLDEDTWGGTYGYLQLDATVNYALKKSEINLTLDELQNTDSPYNTYKYPGLPPTPINSPGEAAMSAALNPADGPWLYYVTVNPNTGETKFTDDYEEFLGFKQELSAWLAENPQ
jgi:UPF0755 protein